MNVPLLDLKAQYSGIQEELEAAVLTVLRSQRYILGPEVEACEQEIADYVNTAHAVGVSSGSDALLIALMAEGIGAGDEVIATPFTFFATVGAIARLGAKAVFADIDPATYNIDPAAIADRITDRTRAIIPVHLYGQSADMTAIMRVAREHDLVVLEDGAQAIGAEWEGQRAGSFGKYGCFSFFPSKNLGAAGDGGVVVTGDADRCETLRCLRAHGGKPKYYHRLVGGNFRLDALQAAVVRVKLRYLDAWTQARQHNAGRYDDLFQATGLPDRGDIVLPEVKANRHIFNQYVIRVRDRDGLAAHLKAQGVGTAIYYPVPMHLQECFADLGYGPGDFPESERAANETLAIPIAPEVTDEQAEYVVDTIQGFYTTEGMP